MIGLFLINTVLVGLLSATLGALGAEVGDLEWWVAMSCAAGTFFVGAEHERKTREKEKRWPH